ncbi:hypothetical protein BC832DRAFT_115137 [Gaertneriomyces semiglobifer]|nr:hypothetical protein BC832DRAFT_115137 [Gaertneriomyces semiglobifer]
MDSTADLIVVSQLDLLDTAGSRRQSIAPNARAARLYRPPGPATRHDVVDIEGGSKTDVTDDLDLIKDTAQLVGTDTSVDTLCDATGTAPAQGDTAEEPTGFRKFVDTNLGLIYMVFASLSFCCMSVSVKAMSLSAEKLPTMEIIFVRSLLVYVMVTSCMFKWGYENIAFGPKEVRGLMVLRGLVGFAGLTCGWYALSVLTLADATVLSFLSPIFTAILARFILKEPYEVLDGVTGFLSMVGVICIARPSFLFDRFAARITQTTPDDLISGGPSEITDADKTSFDIFANATIVLTEPVAETEDPSGRPLGVLLGLAGAGFGALVYIIVRYLAGRATPMHILSMFSLVSLPCSLFLTMILPSPTPWIVPQSPLTYMFLCLVAVSAFSGQLFLCKSLQRETAGKASSMNYVQVLVAFLAEWIIWDVQPSIWSLIGSLIIGSCVILIAVAKTRKK